MPCCWGGAFLLLGASLQASRACWGGLAQGNSFAYACTLAFSYIFDICPPYPATSSIYNPRPPVVRRLQKTPSACSSHRHLHHSTHAALFWQVWRAR
jgi:hypothetical protein